MTELLPPSPPPGWYPNPSGEPGQRYWDGTKWTIVNVPATPTVGPYRRPGWYADPSGEAGQRYWNGREWTGGVKSPVKGPVRSGSSQKALAIIGAVFLMGGGCVAVVTASDNKHNPPRTATTPAVTPTETPDHKFKRDMDDAFDAEMNPGKSPITDIWTYRLFTDDIAATGHDICQYLGSHNYEETAQQFKLKLPLGYPSDSDAREFVDIAINDLCPQYSSMRAPSTTTTTSPAPVPFVGNPNCGQPSGPRTSYLCDEKNFLRKLAEDNVPVPDPVAMIKAGYDVVCAMIGPSDLDDPNLVGDEEKAQATLLAKGVVTSPDNAKAVVSDAVIELC
jgi:hypothetical protein